MVQNSEHGVQVNEHTSLHWARQVNWNDIALFVVLARNESLRAAAREIRVSVNTVREHLLRLERAANTKLFLRSSGGIALSAEGERFLALALEMQAVREHAGGKTGNTMTMNPGEIRIACSEGIGEFWLTPRLTQLQVQLEDYTISLKNELDQRQIFNRSNDIKIGFAIPPQQSNIVTRLATLHFLIYGSHQYLREKGVPRSIDDALNHRFVIHEAPGLFSNGTGLFLGDLVASKIPALKVNTSHSLYRAIADGAGLGALPTYVRAISRQVRPLDVPVRMKFDLWLSYDAELRNSRPIRQVVDWLRGCFDQEKYPWFRESFIHPDDFEGRLAVPEMVRMNDAFGRAEAA